ncbi:MAG: NADH-quinone oxidoreductase subunit NuoE [Alphaproteobacteria bacterium]
MSTTQPTTFAFSKKYQPLVDKALAKYPEDRRRSAVIPLLDLAQRQHGGWVPQPAIELISEMLDMAPIKVLEVATFYTMINTEPVGEHHIQVCTTTPCWLRGSDDVVSACKKKLGIDFGETTKDGKFSMLEVECLGACANAPMIQINDDYYEDLTAESMEKLLDDLAAGKKTKIGSQIGRQASEPEGGATTLQKAGKKG